MLTLRCKNINSFMKKILKFLAILLLFINVTPAYAFLPPKSFDETYFDIKDTSATAAKVTVNNEDVIASKSKTLATILAIIGGVIGLHDFYMENWARGGIKFLLGLAGLFLRILVPPVGYALLAITFIWGIVDAILINSGSLNPKGDYTWKQ
jgi:TM2 domain-containing membrane protein YozV